MTEKQPSSVLSQTVEKTVSIFWNNTKHVANTAESVVYETGSSMHECNNFTST